MVATTSKAEKSRLSAEDWALAALDVIAEQGLAAVAVEPLARRLGVTKGSFYWHFPSREALLVAALERWEKTEQETVFGKLEAVSDPRARLRASAITRGFQPRWQLPPRVRASGVKSGEMLFLSDGSPSPAYRW